MTLMGVNLSSVSFSTNLPGVYGTDYIYPSTADLDYFKSKGMTLVRLPFNWENVQHSAFGALDQTELGRMEAFVSEAAQRGMKVILDAQNFGRYYGDVVGSTAVPASAFQDFWTKLATAFKGNPGVYGYDLMNEPHDMGGPTVWLNDAQAAINGIRSVDPTTSILVEGDNWSGTKDWPTSNNNLLNLHDPSNHLIYEAHSYFDPDGSGTYTGTYDQLGAYPNIGVDSLKPFADWLQANHVHGMVGEYGVPNDDPRWNTVLDNFLQALKQDGLDGTYWAAGPWWGDYKLSVEPVNGKDQPQMAVLQKYASDGSSTPSPSPAPSQPPASSDGAPDTLVLHLSEDAYRGDAQFTVMVDGTKIGGPLKVTASHAAGATQDFSFSGHFGSGPHTVDVTFTNDLYGGRDSADRNLYVDGVDFNGHHVADSAASLWSAGSAHFVVPGSATPSPVPPSSVPPSSEATDSAAQPTPEEARHSIRPVAGTAHGTSGADTITATGSGQTLIGNGGDDIFKIGNHADAHIVQTGSGISTVTTTAASYALPDGVQNLTGSGSAAQTLTGNGGDNYITGGNGKDVLSGGDGNDALRVGTGANHLAGGQGDDVFIFPKPADHDNVISDFTVGHDVLDLRPMMASLGYGGTDPVADGVLHFSVAGGNTVVTIDSGAKPHTLVTLEHVVLSASSSAGDYLWH